MGRVRWMVGSGLVSLMLLAVILVVYAHRTSPAAMSQKPITYSTDKPSEAPVTHAAYTWRGAASDPKYIRLPSIHAEGFIEVMGVDQHNQIAAPNNVNVAGWYVNSVRPGEMGLSIIDGHVDGLTAPGIFKHLDQLEQNDQFTIERGDGWVLAYRILHVDTVDAKSAASVLFSQQAGAVSQLNLITCGGTFDRASKAYEARTIVTAVLVTGGTTRSP